MKKKIKTIGRWTEVPKNAVIEDNRHKASSRQALKKETRKEIEDFLVKD